VAPAAVSSGSIQPVLVRIPPPAEGIVNFTRSDILCIDWGTVFVSAAMWDRARVSNVEVAGDARFMSAVASRGDGRYVFAAQALQRVCRAPVCSCFMSRF
jgi:hypothetical protein